jgi:ribose/xylose/arabinose/galactoside ABC-type transport system permease subunit
VKLLKQRKEFGILFIILALVIIITIINPAFLKPANLFDMIRSNAVYGVMAFGMLLILITGGIDLTCSSTIVLCAVLQGSYLKSHPDTNVVVIFLMVIVAGAIVGLVNGLLITKLKIPPIVATLGIQTITNAAVLYVTKGAWISDLPQWWKDFGAFTIPKIPSGNTYTGIYTQVLLLIAVGIITWLILRYTLVGRGLYAVGGNAQSAERVGYKVDLITIFAYIYCGITAGLASIVSVSIVGSVDPNTFTGYEMDVIAITVLGGASLSGGVGTVFGTTLGIILMSVIKNGLILVHISGYWQDAIMGAIILVTIIIDQIRQNREADKAVKVDVEE